MKPAVDPSSKAPNMKAKLGSSGWQELGGSPEGDEMRKAVTQRLSQRILDQNLVCLIGSGVSLGVGGPSMGDLWELAQKQPHFDHAITISGHPKASADIEVFLSRCRMAEQFHGKDAKLTEFITKVQTAITTACRQFLTSTAPLPTHCSFLQQLARRSNEAPRTMVFTTNYDLCIEQAAGQSGLPVIDGFSHTDPQRFDGRNYDLDYVRRVPNQREPSFVEGAFHLYKLHGSVNWAARDGEIIRDSQTAEGVMIFPRESKYQLSYQHPFLEMMARFQFALRQPNTTLFALGFGFNDDHLSEPIIAALRSNPQFNLVVATRSLAKKSEGDDANHHMKVLSELAGAPGIESVTLIDGTFDQFVPLVPTVGTQSDEQRFAEIARRILQPKPKP
jgi:hypothetical protein